MNKDYRQQTIVTVQKGKKIHLGLNHVANAGLMVADPVTVTREGNQFKLTKKEGGKGIGNHGVDVPPSMTEGFEWGDEFEVTYAPDEIILTLKNYDD